MCGIAGIHSPESGAVSRSALSGMIAALRHRGPDGFGIFMDERVGLAHARLSMVDPAGGAQPIANEDQTLWILCDGGIFNYVELRENLVRRGHAFSTRSDTEVILHLYEEKGKECLRDLNGQFAFAIWDSLRKELFIARDRVGIRPLFYTLQGDTLLFASEIKALLAYPGVRPAWNPKALDQIFTFWTPLPGQTAFADIRELKSGHYLVAKHGNLRETRYWSLPVFPREEQMHCDPEEASEEAMRLLGHAVRIRLRADVEVGCHLSGGLDSSILSTLARRQHPKLRTFGAGFGQADLDGTDRQIQMALHLGTRHHRVTATDVAIGENFPDIAGHAETPLLRMGPVPLHLLSKSVREQGVKAILIGEGADEVFGGCDIFREALIRNFWAKRPGSAMRASLIPTLHGYAFRDPRQAAAMTAFFGQGLGESGDPLFSHLLRWRHTRKLKRFFSAGFREATRSEDGIEEFRATLPAGFARLDAFTKAQYLEMDLFMRNYLLSSQGDRVAMANSVELRFPFLDHRLIEFMAKVPSRWKILGSEGKFLLRRMFRGSLPERILQRPDNPYRAPVPASAKACAGLAAIESLLDRKAIESAGIFDPAQVEMLRNKLAVRDRIGGIGNMALAGIVSTMAIDSRFMRGASTRTAPEPKFTVDVDRRLSESMAA
jgi:asparagine synthase (glutamine-hydrolysing)